jgi:hypothetical protein
MELTLNLAWMMLATLMCCLWMRFTPRQGATRRAQLVALALVILIMLPVISVTDDLMAARNPAETDCCQRKHHACSNEHPPLHAVAGLSLPLVAGFSSGRLRLAAPRNLTTPQVKIPALSSIQNRPPPAA